MDEARPEGIALILRAIDLTIARIEARESSDREEQLEILRCAREGWQQKAEKERGR